MRVDDFLGLASGVADLRPEMVAIAGGGPGPTGQRRPQGGIGLAIDDHVTRPLQVVGIHLYIAREQQPRPAVAPDAVQALQFRSGQAIRRRQTLSHGGLGQAIG